jgi:transcriptional regulator with PAS, ATPase and Fis domain
MTELIIYLRPGNVRELEDIIERALIVAKGQELHLAEKID